MRVHANLEFLLAVELDTAFASVKPLACAPVDPLDWSLVFQEVIINFRA